MNSDGKQHVHHALPLALATTLALSLGACGQGPSSEKVGGDIEQAIDEGGRGWEQVANIADERIEPATRTTTRGKASGKTSDDAALSSKVKSALIAEPGLKALAIEVNAVNGAVTLYGTANTPARRDKATQLALNVDGVKSVTNHLFILRGS